MSIAYAGINTFALQPGTEIETTPEGLTTVTLKYRGKTADRATFVAAWPRGTACPVSGYTALAAVASPRVVEDGAYSMGYVVFQGAPAGSGTSESELDINYTSETRTTVISLTSSGDDHYTVTYQAPTVVASYVAGAKPGSFRFKTLVDSEEDPKPEKTEKANPNATTRILIVSEHYKVKKESKWIDRRNVGGIWRCTEQHSNIIVNTWE